MSAHVGGQMLTLEGKIRSLGRAFTSILLSIHPDKNMRGKAVLARTKERTSMIDWEPHIVEAQQQRSYDIQGHSYFRIPYGDESVEAAIIAEQHPCHDCAVERGMLHVAGCD